MEQEKRQKQKGKGKKKKLEAGILATLIMLLFRIPLANFIGDEGNGYLAISWEIYGFFALLFGYGYSKVVSQMVKSRISKNLYRNSMRSMKTTLLVGFFSSSIAAVVLYFASAPLGSLLFGTNLVEISLKLFAPLLVLTTILGIFRGYFEGMGTHVPTQISRLVEAVVMATGSFVFSFLTMNYGKKIGTLLHNTHFEAGFGAAGVVAGYLSGGLLAILFLGFVDILYKQAYTRLLKKDMTKVVETRISLIKEIFTTLPGCLLPLLCIRLYRLTNLYLYGSYRLKGEEALSGIRIIGSFYGKTSVLMALAVVLILFFTKGQSRMGRKPLSHNEFRTVRQVMGEELHRLFALAMPVMGTFLVLAETLLKTLYGSGGRTEYTLLGLSGISLVFISLGVYLSHILDSLQMKKQMILLQFAAFFLQTLAMLFLQKLPAVGGLLLSDLSLGLAELIFWLIFSIGQLLILIKIYRLRLPWGRIFLAPSLQTMVMIIVEVIIVQLLKSSLPYWGVCILAVIAGGIFHQLTKKIPLLNRE